MQAETMLVKLFKALGDHSRLEIVKALIKKPMYVEILAQCLQLNASTVSFHLKKLQECGLVTASREQYYMVYTLEDSLIATPIKTLIANASNLETAPNDKEKEYQTKVLSTFLVNGKLTRLPIQRKKRRIILEYIAGQFAWDTAYPEREFSLSLSEFHEDFCTLRREMICEKLFLRKDAIYYRMDGQSPS